MLKAKNFLSVMNKSVQMDATITTFNGKHEINEMLYLYLRRGIIGEITRYAKERQTFYTKNLRIIGVLFWENLFS